MLAPRFQQMAVVVIATAIVMLTNLGGAGLIVANARTACQSSGRTTQLSDSPLRLAAAHG